MRYLISVLIGLFLGVPALGQDSKVAVRVVADRQAACPGDQMVVAVVLEIADGWHVQANKEAIKGPVGELVQDPTTIKATLPVGFTMGPIQWPSTKELSAGALGDPNAKVPVFEGRAIAYVPVIVDAKAPLGKCDLAISVRQQACDEKTCVFPETTDAIVAINVVSPGTAPVREGPGDPTLFSGFDSGIFSRMLLGRAPAETLIFTFFGRSIEVGTTGVGFAALLALAVLGGFLLNLTPCVLPVIPIKIMGLQHSAGTPGRRVLLGSVMFLGVIAFWVGIGAAIAFVTGFTAINQLFQFPAFSIGVGVFIGAMGVGMLGLFSVNLPQWVYAVDPKRESIPGSFVFGVMTAVLSTPCTAPFMGTAAAWAARQPSAITLLTFGAIGIGMGLPYFGLALFPQLVARVPKAGPGSELVKQVMGLLMLAVAVFFVGTGLDPLLRQPVDLPFRAYWWAVGALVATAGGVLAWRTWRITTRGGPRALWGICGAALIAAGAWIGLRLSDNGPIDWIGYTPERLAKALAEKKVVVLDFTAEWCINCKTLEKGVLHQDSIVHAFKQPDVIPMRVDLSGNNAPGQAKLKELNWVGIPLLAIYGPGAVSPSKHDTYTPQVVLDAIAKARGGGT